MGEYNSTEEESTGKEMKQKWITPVLLVALTILILLNLKTCQDGVNAKKVYNQNLKAANDTIRYKNGVLKKYTYIMSQSDAEEVDTIVKIVTKEIKGEKIIDLKYVFTKYEQTIELNSDLVQQPDESYKLSFGDSNVVRTIYGEMFLKIDTDKKQVNDSTFKEVIKLSLLPKYNNKTLYLRDEFKFGLGIVESEKRGFKQLNIIPYEIVYKDGKPVFGNKIDSTILKFPKMESYSFELPKKTSKNGLALNLGLGATAGVNPFTYKPSFILGPTISFGYSIRSIKELIGK
jgi:hypothetical protein